MVCLNWLVCSISMLMGRLIERLEWMVELKLIRVYFVVLMRGVVL